MVDGRYRGDTCGEEAVNLDYEYSSETKRSATAHQITVVLDPSLVDAILDRTGRHNTRPSDRESVRL